MTTTPAHAVTIGRVRDDRGASSYVAGCDCGWRSEPAPNAVTALQAGKSHKAAS